jgi:GNAT superfamily N-acetyltransferase
MIRPAETKDLPQIGKMGREFFDASGLSEVTEWDALSFDRTARFLMEAGDHGSLLVADHPGVGLVGMAGSLIFPLYCNHTKSIGQETFWWVDPDYRSGVGGLLLDELEADARRKGADIFMSAQLAGQHDRAFARIYVRRGYVPAENTFIRKLKS